MPPKKKAGAAKKSKVAVPGTIPELETVLRAFLGGNPGQFAPEQITQHVLQATEVLRHFLTLPQSVPALFSRLNMADLPQDTRQLTCVLLCKNITKFWFGLHKTHMLGNTHRHDADACREMIMKILHAGDAPAPVVQSLSYLTFLIARADIVKNRWPGIIEWLGGALQSTNTMHVDSALRILFNLLNSPSAGPKLSNHYPQYYPVFQHWALNAPTASIRNRAILALRPLLALVEDDEQQEIAIESTLLALMPSLVNACKAHEYDTIKSLVAIYRNTIGSEGWEKHKLQIFQILSPLLLDVEFDYLARLAIGDFYLDVIRSEPVSITQERQLPDGSTVVLLSVFFQVVFGLLLEEDDDPFGNESRPQKLAIAFLENFFQYLPIDAVFPTLCQHFVKFVQSPDPLERKAAFVLSIVAGSYAPNATNLGDKVTLNGKTAHFLDIAIDAACDGLMVEQHPLVRIAMCLSLIYFGENLEAALELNDLFIRPLTTALALIPQIPPNYPDPNYKCYLLNVIDVMCCAGGVKVAPYLGNIMSLLTTQLRTGTIESQQTTIASIKYVAESVGEAINPYFSELLPLFLQILSTPTTEEIREFQQKTLITLSACVRNVPVAQWGPELSERLNTFFTMAFEALDDEGLTEYTTVDTYVAFLSNIIPPFAQMSEELSPDVKAFLTKCYDAFIRVLRSIDGLNRHNESEDLQMLRGFGGLDDDDDNDATLATNFDLDEMDEAELAEEDSGMFFATASLDAKNSATTALSILFDELGSRLFQLQPEKCTDDDALLQHIINLEDDCEERGVAFEEPDREALAEEYQLTTNPLLRALSVLIESSSMINDSYLRTCLLTSVQLLVDTLGKMNVMPMHIGERHPLTSDLCSAFDPVVSRLVEAIREDKDVAVVAIAAEGLGYLYDAFGASVVSETFIEMLYQGLAAIITEQSICFVDAEQRDELSDQGSEAMTAACALLEKQAKYYGALFKTEFLECEDGVFFDALFNLATNSKRPKTFSAAAVGSLSQIMCALPQEHTIQMAFRLLPAMVDNLYDSYADLQNNAAHCTRVACNALYNQTEVLAAIDPAVIQKIFQGCAAKILTFETYKAASQFDQCLSDNNVSAAINLIRTFPHIITPSLIPQVLNSLPLLGDIEERNSIATNFIWFYQTYTEQMKPLTGAVLAHIACLFENPPSEFPQKPTLVAFAQSLIQQFPQEASTAPQYLSQQYVNAVNNLQAHLNAQ